jgi:hypothetical protein
MGAAVLEGGGEEQAVPRWLGTARRPAAARRWLAARRAAARGRG